MRSATRAKYAVWTAVVACSAVIPETSTLPIKTPSAIIGGGGGGASARAWLAPTPRAQTTRQRMKPARLATDRWILAFGPYASVDQGASVLPNDDDGEVVGEVASCEVARVFRDRGRERARRQLVPLREQCVETVVAIQLAVPTGLDDAVGVEDERGAERKLGVGLRVLLAAVDPEHEAVRLERLRRPVREDDPRRGMASTGCCDPAAAAVDDDVAHADELAGADLAADHVVRGGEEVGRLRMLARERAEDELRHRHVRGRVDAVAGHVAEHDRESPVLQREEVVDVAADVHACRRLVHLADLEPLDHGARTGQQRALHRVGELLLLLVEPGVVDRERRLRRERRRRLDRFLRERVTGAEREDAKRGDDHGRQGNGDDRRRPALLDKRHEGR